MKTGGGSFGYRGVPLKFFPDFDRRFSYLLNEANTLCDDSHPAETSRRTLEVDRSRASETFCGVAQGKNGLGDYP